MQSGTQYRSLLVGAGLAALVASAPAAALDLNFDYKLNQGPTGVTFATLSMNEFTPGTTTFGLSTALTGGAGNPEIVELLFGCKNCGSPVFAGTDVSVQGGGFTQSGYNFDFRAEFDPDVKAGPPRTWTASGPLSAFLESTSGSGPAAFAVIQLTGGMQTIGGQNISSGFYIAADSASVAPIPEPETYAILLVGLGLTGVAVTRRRKRA